MEDASPINQEDKLLNIVDIQEWLGISRTFAYKLVEEDSIPHHRIGQKNIRFKKSEVQEWLDNSRRGG